VELQILSFIVTEYLISLLIWLIAQIDRSSFERRVYETFSTSFQPYKMFSSFHLINLWNIPFTWSHLKGNNSVRSSHKDVWDSQIMCFHNSSENPHLHLTLFNLFTAPPTPFISTSTTINSSCVLFFYFKSSLYDLLTACVPASDKILLETEISPELYYTLRIKFFLAHISSAYYYILLRFDSFFIYKTTV